MGKAIELEILFSDYFAVSRQVLKDYGTFDISLVSDLPLFIDPFLLFQSDKPEYRRLHDGIIRYLSFLREKTATRHIDDGLLEAWFHFKEVKETWLGFSREGNEGRGLWKRFANTLRDNLCRVFASPNELHVTQERHVEKLCLISNGVGRDCISDFTTNLIKDYLLSYTEIFAKTHLSDEQCGQFDIRKASFDYETESWARKSYYLPKVGGDYVILVPRDILTKDDTWINRTELLDQLIAVPDSLLDNELRAQFDHYIFNKLGESPAKKDLRETVQEFISAHPEIADSFIRDKENRCDEAVAISDSNVAYAQTVFIENFRGLADLVAKDTDFYQYDAGTIAGALDRLTCLKQVIEDHGGQKFLYDDTDMPIHREDELNVLYRFLWLGRPDARVGKEAVRVDFKLASTAQLNSYLQKLVRKDDKINRDSRRVTAVFYFSEGERLKLETSLIELGQGAERILEIDASKRANDVEKGDLAEFRSGHALVIGIANYPGINKLSEVVLKDARDVAQTLQSPDYCGYRSSNVRLLLDDQATKSAIYQGLEWLAAATGPGDTAIIYFSGHGGAISTSVGTQNYLLPYDADPADMAGTAIAGDDMTSNIRRIKAQRLVVLFDSCHSGGTGDPKSPTSQLFKSGLTKDYFDRLAHGTGRIVMASSRHDEVSWILNGMDNSLFTHHLLEALQGKAHTRGDEHIRIFQVFAYVADEVSAKADQHPVFKASDVENNFPIALYKGGRKLSTEASPSTMATHIDETMLREFMERSFNSEELELLCADVEGALVAEGQDSKINMDIVGGTTLPIKILHLIEYLDRRKQLGYLVSAVRRVRPGQI